MKMVQVDLRKLFSFSVTGMADFLGKKQRPPRNLASARVSMTVRRDGDTDDCEKGRRHGSTL